MILWKVEIGKELRKADSKSVPFLIKCLERCLDISNHILYEQHLKGLISSICTCKIMSLFVYMTTKMSHPMCQQMLDRPHSNLLCQPPNGPLQQKECSGNIMLKEISCKRKALLGQYLTNDMKSIIISTCESI